jgi:hypothetical protein
MDEGHIDGYAGFSGLSDDTTNRDDMLARSDELFGHEANVKSSIEVAEKAFEHVLEALEAAASGGHPFRQVIDDLWRLKASKRLAISWSSGIIERPDSLLVLFFKGHYRVLLPGTPSQVFLIRRSD